MTVRTRIAEGVVLEVTPGEGFKISTVGQCRHSETPTRSVYMKIPEVFFQRLNKVMPADNSTSAAIFGLATFALDVLEETKTTLKVDMRKGDDSD